MVRLDYVQNFPKAIGFSVSAADSAGYRAPDDKWLPLLTFIRGSKLLPKSYRWTDEIVRASWANPIAGVRREVPSENVRERIIVFLDTRPDLLFRQRVQHCFIRRKIQGFDARLRVRVGKLGTFGIQRVNLVVRRFLRRLSRPPPLDCERSSPRAFDQRYVVGSHGYNSMGKRDLPFDIKRLTGGASNPLYGPLQQTFRLLAVIT